MKKYIVLFSIALLGLTACKSDYLDTAPEDMMGTATVLSSTDNAALSINGICKAMTNQYLGTQGMNGEGTINVWYADVTGNDMQRCNQTGWAPLWNSQYHLQKSSIYLYYPWFYYYKLIGNANGIICNIDNASGTESEKAFLKAQALTFRAYSFFRLAELYCFRWKDTQGNTPGIVLRIDQSTGDQPLSTLAETYAQIYKDLDEAIALYSVCGMDRDKNEFYKPNINVAYAVYARAALTREDWQNAVKYAQLARQGYKLMSASDYFDGFSSQNSEWIWGVYEASDQTLYYYSMYAYLASNASSSMQRTYPLCISRELIDQIPETDTRRSLFLVPQNDGEFSDGFAANGNPRASAASNKDTSSPGSLRTRAFSENGSRLYSTSQVYPYMHFKFLCTFTPGGGPFCIFRSAEMYYIEAEADCHLNQDAAAQQLLYDVTSIYDKAYTKSTKTGNDLLEEVKLYRRFDLWGEGHNYFDYKRWGEPIVRKAYSAGGSFHTTFAITIKPEDGNNWTWAIPNKESDYNADIN